MLVFLCLLVSELGARTQQTDGQTDRLTGKMRSAAAQ